MPAIEVEPAAQAGHLFGQTPEQAREALRSIELKKHEAEEHEILWYVSKTSYIASLFSFDSGG
jgi:hypothetical protein